MTGQDFIDQFNILYDKVGSLNAPSYTDEEILFFLNKAQIEFILTYYDSKERAVVGNFDSSERNKVYLSNLEDTYMTYVTYLDTSKNKTNGVFVVKPSDHLFTTLERTKVGADSYVWTKPITKDEYNLNKANPFKRPDKDVVFWREDYGVLSISGTKDTFTTAGVKSSTTVTSQLLNVYEIIGDGTEITGYYMNYIRMPNKIGYDDDTIDLTVGCELHEITYNIILEMAVRIATSVTNPENYQIRDNETKIIK